MHDTLEKDIQNSWISTDNLRRLKNAGAALWRKAVRRLKTAGAGASIELK